MIHSFLKTFYAAQVYETVLAAGLAQQVMARTKTK
jgi:hypothetical protein